MEHTAALNLRPLLSEKCVILTGGRDRLNNILIQFPCDSLIDKLSSDDLQNVILYLASIPSFIKKSFVFIIDMRGRKYESVKPILKILQNLQENYQYYIHHVFIIKPDTFWQKQKTSFASSKYNFEQSLISIEQLSKYVDPTQLTQDLEGSLPYNNDQWIEFRIKLEIYINQTNDMLSKFNALQIELSTFEQPDTKEACQEAIIAHTSTKQRVFSMNIEQLLAEAKQLLKILIGHDNNEILLAPVGTRDSGYSGSESEKFNCDYFNEASKIKEPMEQLRIAKQKVQNLWQQKKLKLEQCLQLRVFEQDCSQMMDWLNYNNKSVLMNYTDIGQSFSSAHDLLQKHEQFHKNCFSGAASVQHITSVAGKLIASSHYASNLITLKTNKLEKEWQLFHAALQNRQKILSASCMFHKKADQYLGKVAEWKSQCSSTQLANSVQEAENLLKKHHELSDDISQIYAEVCNDGKAILDSIQSSQSTQIGQMEFKQAASHILDIVYEILSNHRQLELLWVNKKQKLQNRYRMLNFQQNIKQVYNWLENHGEVFLRRNQSLGKNLMRAKMLHLSHENFVKVLKNTITNVEKLLASADDLVMNGEFEPQDIYSMTKELEQRMTLFLQRVEKRKNILDLSVLFHTHVVELDNWFNELKIHWTSLNLNDINQFNLSSIEAINSNIDLFEKHLEILNEQKSVTSDAIDKTILEGDALIDYLKEMGSKNEESNNASNNNSNKQNSHAYLDSIVSSVKSRYNEIDSLLSSIKHRLETNLQIKIFEKDALEASQNLEHWAEELKYLDENQNDERTPESTESWLHSQIQTANQMQVLIFELLQRGSDLAVYLEKIENTTSTPLSTTSTTNSTTSLNDSTQNNNDNKTTTTTTKPNDTLSNNQHTLNWLKQQNSLNNNQISNNLNLTAKQRIQSFVEYLNEREKELHDLAIKQQRKLGQTLQINQLENECTQLLGFISNIEMTLFSMLKFAANLDEAEQCKKEHELFKSNLERVSVNVNMLQTKATRILYDKQQQQQRNVTKFEQLVNSLNSKWQMLLIYVDNRTRLIMAQINFYKYTDQVTTVLESLEHEYGREEDWYEKSKIEYDPEQYLQTQLQIHNQKKQSFLKACNWARRTGETFQKYSLRNICDAKINTNALSSIETNTKKIMDDIHNKEERTIKSWTNRKNSLDECFQYVIFEKSSKEALAWLHESEQSYLNKFQNLGNNKDEMKKLYKEFCEFTDRLKNQQGYVNLLIELSPKLLETSIRYGNNIAIWANKVETRYKEFFNIMSKVQQTYGLQVTSSNQTCTSPSSLSSSSMSINSTENSISTTTTNHTHSTTTTSLTADSQKSIDNNQKLSLSSANETNKQQEILKHNEQKQKLIRKRQNIITEIIQTEKSYVQDLSDCLDSYYREFIVNSVSQPDYLKGKESIIFGNLEEIFSFHKKTFLVELENYENMPEDIGHCFVIYADQFQIYVEYCKNKENSTKILLEDGKNENYFEKLQRNGQLKCSLDSYLIKPIQRITKYQLLLKDLLSCCEDNRNETKDALDVMISVPKKANDAIHLSHLEGLEEGLSKDALGDVLLQDKFQVWDSKQLIKKAKDRHVFLFETSLVFAKEIKDQRGKLKYIYKFKLMTSEINITEHMEGDSCKLAVWTGRAPLSDHRVIMKTANLDIKQIWVKKIRELIQEKYFYMEVAMCEAGQRSNRNSKDFDLDTDFTTTSSNPHHNHHHHHNVNLNMISENFSSTASNASSGTKASNEVNCLTSDYTTADNIQLFKGQHVQIIQRLNNDTCLVHVINNSAESTSDLKSSKQLIEVQIPAQLIKMRNNKLHTDDSQSASSNFTENDESSKLPGLINSTAAAAAKRKGSFKKWLRSSHRKFTSNNGSTNNTTNTTITTSNGNRKSENEMNTQKYLNLSSGSDLKVLSNSEDIKMKNWLIEENNEDLDENNEEDLEENSNNDQEIATNSITISTSSLSKLNTNNTKNGDEDQEDMTSTIIPPPMNVIKPEHADQNTPSSFSKLPTQSIDIQRELKLWQSKMENSKKADAGNVLCEKINDLNNTTLTIQSNNSAAITDLNSSETMSNELNQTNTSVEKIQKPPESKLIYAIKELLNTEIDYVNDLAILIDKYMEAIKRNDIPMPQDMEGGKDKIVFGNIQQIYEWHKSTFSPELEKCLSESSSYIGQLFVKYENRFQMYVKYCENKPKSEYIVSEYDTYFDELRIKLNQKLNIQDLLIKPVQRIMKYQLMLKEIKKYMEKEGKDCKTINRAIEIMVTVPKNADDMMNVGRLQGFEGRITAQGRLLMQDTILVHEPDTDSKQKKDKQLKLKERRVFLFQQIVIFSEMIGSTKKFSSPRYVFKTDMKVNKMQFSKDDAQLQFTLTDKTPESNRKILCQCEDVNKYNIFVAQLQDLLDMQNEFLRNLQHPQLAMSKGSSSLGSNNNSMLNSSHSSASANNHNNNNNNNNHHHGNIITNTFNDFLKSTFSFSSSPGSNKSNNNSINSPVSPQTAPVLTNNTTNNNNTKSLKTAPVNMLSTSSSSTTSPTTSTTSTSNPYFSTTTTTTPTPVGTTATPNTSIQNDHNLDKLNADLSQQLSLDNSEKNNNNNSSSNNSNIPNSAKVIGSYSAITEDEITVQKGDIVQIITANMHNRFLVHREANEHQPAAEGWIPGFVIGFQSTNLTLN